MGPQGMSGRVRKISPPSGIDPRKVQFRSESLYRLSYPGPCVTPVYRVYSYAFATRAQTDSQHDGESACFVRELMEFLNENYKSRCIAVVWPTRSPDFSIFKCYMWNCVRRQCNLVVHQRLSLNTGYK